MKKSLSVLMMRKQIYEAIPVDPSYISHTDLCIKTSCKNPEAYLKSDDPIAEGEKGLLAFISQKTKDMAISEISKLVSS